MSSLIKIQKNVALKNYTTFKIGGSAKFFIEVKNLEELKQSLTWAKQKSLPIFILGRGSNLLVRDEGFEGLVIKMKNEKLKVKNAFIEVEAGTNLNSLIKKCLKNKLTGLENLAGIPGTLGGAIRGNAGAWGNQISDFVKTAQVFDLNTLELKNFTKQECQFGYRSSVFKKNKNLIIWSATLELKQDDVQRAEKIIKENFEKRKSSQPNLPSAGCVFKNLREKYFNEFIENNSDLEIPENFLQNKVIPVAWLIDQLKLKGTKIGGAEISEQHANFIVNFKNASAEDVFKLINLVKTKVAEKFKVNLEEEIQLI